MKSRVASLVFLIAFQSLAAFAAGHPAAKPVPKKEASSAKTEEAPFSNKDVLALAKADLGDSIIIAKIQQVSTEVLDVSADALISLKKNGVSQPIIEAMIKRVDRRNHPADLAANPAKPAPSHASRLTLSPKATDPPRRPPTQAQLPPPKTRPSDFFSRRNPQGPTKSLSG